MSYNYNYYRQYYLTHKKQLDSYRRQWALNNPEKESEYKAKWLKENLDHIYKWEKKRNPIIRKAYYTLRNAIKSGKVQKEKCKQCGLPAHAHHPDYSRPLSVQWLCPLHHKKLHLSSISD